MSPYKKLSQISTNILNDFTYITAVGTISGNPHITETAISYDIAVSQYVKTASQGAYETFIITAFHSPQNKYVLSHTKVYHPGSRIKIDGALELYDNSLYCDLHNSTFVVPKSTHNNSNNNSSNNSNNNNNNDIKTPSSSNRAVVCQIGIYGILNIIIVNML